MLPPSSIRLFIPLCFLPLPFSSSFLCASSLFHSALHSSVLPPSSIQLFIPLCFLPLPFGSSFLCASSLFHSALHSSVLPPSSIQLFIPLCFLPLPFSSSFLSSASRVTVAVPSCRVPPAAHSAPSRQRQGARVAGQHAGQQGSEGACGGRPTQHRALPPRRQARAERGEGAPTPGTAEGALRPVEGDDRQV